MNIFEDYTELYDLFYEEKDYPAECDYIIELASEYTDHSIDSILDIGCGTGKHALLWAQHGIKVTGMDRSHRMLEYARKKADESGVTVSFREGDIRSYDLKKTFDIVTAMFAVMSYQIRDDDVLSALRCVRQHLKRGGLFFFDAWFGPGVLSDHPHDRVSSFWKEGVEILRTVRPKHIVDRHTVEVYYDILCLKDKEVIKRIKETHVMRYFFIQEMEDFAVKTGFELLMCEPFMKKGEQLTDDTWSATFLLRAA